MLFFKYSAVQLLKYIAVQVLKYSMAQLCAVPAPTQGFPAGFPLDSSSGATTTTTTTPMIDHWTPTSLSMCCRPMQCNVR